MPELPRTRLAPAMRYPQMRLASALMVLVVLIHAANAADWPQWRYDCATLQRQPAGVAGEAATGVESRAAAAQAGLARSAEDAVRRRLRAGRRRAAAVRRLVAAIRVTAYDTAHRRGAVAVLRRRAGAVSPAGLGGARSTSPATTATCTASRPRMAGSLWKFRGGPTRPQDPGQRAADLDLAGPRRAGHRRRHGLLRRRHLAVHGHLPARPRCPHGRGASGPTTATARSTSSSRTTPTRSPASRRRGRWWRSATSCWSPAAARCPPATTATTGKLLYYQLAENGKRGGGSRSRRSIRCLLQRRRGLRPGRPRSISARPAS